MFSETTILTYGARPTVSGNVLDWVADASFQPLPVDFSIKFIGELFTTDQYEVVRRDVKRLLFAENQSLV